MNYYSQPAIPQFNEEQHIARIEQIVRIVTSIERKWELSFLPVVTTPHSVDPPFVQANMMAVANEGRDIVNWHMARLSAASRTYDKQVILTAWLGIGPLAPSTLCWQTDDVPPQSVIIPDTWLPKLQP